MFHHILLGVIVCALSWVYLRWLKVKHFWMERGVPHLPPHPILGSLTFLHGLNIGLWMVQMDEHFRTPYIGIWLFWRPALIINSPEIARRVLVKDAGSFRNRFAGGGDSDPIGKLMLVTVDDPLWAKLRRRLTGAFTAAKLRIIQDLVRSKSKELAQRIQREQTSRVSLKSLFGDYTTDVIGTSVFGVACNATLTGKDHVRSVADVLMTYSLYRAIGFYCIFFWPELVDIFRFKFFPKPAIDKIRKIFKVGAAQREANGSAGEARDILDTLLQLRKQNSDNNEGVIVCALSWVYLRWLKVKHFWMERGVPHLPPHPILGSLTFLHGLNIGLWMVQMDEHLRTPYIGIWLFWRPALIINSPEIARRVLVKDAGSFRNRFAGGGDSDPIGKLMLATVDDPLWAKLRRRLTGAFTAAKLRIIQDLVRSKSKELAQRIQREQTSRVSLKSLFGDYTTDVIGTSVFGVACNATLTGKDHVRSVADVLMTYSLYRAIGFYCIFFWPELVDIFRFKFFPKPAIDKIRKIFKVGAAQREANGSAGEARDILDTLLQLRKQNSDNNEGFSEDTIIAQAAIFMLVGSDTTGSLLTFIIYELAFYHDIQEKLYEEIIKVKKNNGSNEFSSEQLAELSYLNCVIKETLRKHAVMGWLDRVATSDYQIDDSLSIKAGTPIYVNAMGMHYNPAYFCEPKKFDPDRFLPENEKNIKPYTFLPFGEGPRNCIGQRFALMSTRYATAAVILNYKVQPFPNTPKPEDVVIEKRGLFYAPEKELCVEFVPRT